MEATRFAQSMLISDLAIQYYELIGLDRRKEVLRNALASARRSHELTRQLKKEGAETQLAVDQFYARVLSIESKLLENDQLIGEKERAIACLLGVFPFEIRRMGFDELRKLPVPLSEGFSEPLDIASGCTFRRDGVDRLQGGCDSGEGGFYPRWCLAPVVVSMRLMWVSGFIRRPLWCTTWRRVSRLLSSAAMRSVRCGTRRRLPSVSLYPNTTRPL